MASVFVSYRRRDCSFIAAVVCERLERRFGSGSVFLDVDDIPLAADFREFMAKALEDCRAMLVFIGERWLVGEDGGRRFDDPGDCVRWEIESARQRQITLVPVLAGLSAMPPEGELPDSIRFLCRLQAAEVHGGRHFFADLERLEEGVARILGYFEKPVLTGEFGRGVSAPAHVLALAAIEERLPKVPKQRAVQKSMLVQAAAGGHAILDWGVSAGSENWRTDPFGAIELLRGILASDEGDVRALENAVD